MRVTADMFIDAMGGISQQLITEAASGSRQIKEGIITRISTVAAAVVLVCSAVILSVFLSGRGGPATPAVSDRDPDVTEDTWVPSEGFHTTSGMIGDVEISVRWQESVPEDGTPSYHHSVKKLGDSDKWEIYDADAGNYTIIAEVKEGGHRGFYLFDLKTGKYDDRIMGVLDAVGVDAYRETLHHYSCKYMWFVTVSDSWDKMLVHRLDEITEDNYNPYKTYYVEFRDGKREVTELLQVPEIYAAFSEYTKEYPYIVCRGWFDSDAVNKVTMEIELHDSLRSVKREEADAFVRLKYDPSDGSVTVLKSEDLWIGADECDFVADGVPFTVMWYDTDIFTTMWRVRTTSDAEVELISGSSFEGKCLVRINQKRYYFCYPGLGVAAEADPNTNYCRTVATVDGVEITFDWKCENKLTVKAYAEGHEINISRGRNEAVHYSILVSVDGGLYSRVHLLTGTVDEFMNDYVRERGIRNDGLQIKGWLQSYEDTEFLALGYPDEKIAGKFNLVGFWAYDFKYEKIIEANRDPMPYSLIMANGYPVFWTELPGGGVDKVCTVYNMVSLESAAYDYTVDTLSNDPFAIMVKRVISAYLLDIRTGECVDYANMVKGSFEEWLNITVSYVELDGAVLSAEIVNDGGRWCDRCSVAKIYQDKKRVWIDVLNGTFLDPYMLDLKTGGMRDILAPLREDVLRGSYEYSMADDKGWMTVVSSAGAVASILNINTDEYVVLSDVEAIAEFAKKAEETCGEIIYYCSFVYGEKVTVYLYSDNGNRLVGQFEYDIKTDAAVLLFDGISEQN